MEKNDFFFSPLVLSQWKIEMEIHKAWLATGRVSNS